MNLPSLPTDNLYKFISIFGLIIVSISIYYNQVWEEKLYNESNGDIINSINNLRKQMRVLETISENMLGDYEDYSEIKQESEKDLLEFERDLKLIEGKSVELVDGLDKEDYEELIEETKNELNQIEYLEELKVYIDSIKVEYNMSFSHIPNFDGNSDNNLENLKIELEKLNAVKFDTSLRIEMAYDAYDQVFIKCIVVFTIGFIIMIFGFTMWYKKFQRYTDAEKKFKSKVFLESSEEEKDDIIIEIEKEIINNDD